LLRRTSRVLWRRMKLVLLVAAAVPSISFAPLSGAMKVVQELTTKALEKDANGVISTDEAAEADGDGAAVPALMGSGGGGSIGSECSDLEPCNDYPCMDGRCTCHPHSSLLEREDGVKVAIGEARVGARVKTPSGFVPIAGFIHQEATIETTYLEIEAGTYKTRISHVHHIFVGRDGGVAIPAQNVTVGDVLNTIEGSRIVTNVRNVRDSGMYAIILKGGEYYLDGVKTSAFVDFGLSKAVWAYYPEGYILMRYELGLPWCGLGCGVIDIAWLRTRLAARLDASVFEAVSPFLLPVEICAEITNAVLNYSVGWFREFDTLGIASRIVLSLVASVVGAGLYIFVPRAVVHKF